MRVSNGDGDEGVGGLVVGGGALVLVLGGVYQATQASQVSETTAYIAGAVAITVALITWFATDRRQAKALAAERERHDRELTAENDRHRETLAHEHEARELEELRKILDKSTERLSAANIKTADAVLKWKHLPPSPSNEQRSSLATVTTEAYDAWIAAEAEWYRVTLRLGDEHPVARALDGVQIAIRGLGAAISFSAPPSDDEKKRLDELEETRGHKLAEFRKAAVEAVGSRL